MRKIGFWAFFGFAAFLQNFGSYSNFTEANAAPVAHKDWSFTQFGLIPIQSGGRIKPLDSYAREVVLFQTGSRRFQGWEPLDLFVSWIASPQEWEKTPLIQIGREDVKRQLGLDEKQQRFSPGELIKNPILLQYAEKQDGRSQSSGPPGAPRKGPREQEMKSVFERIGLFHSLITGQGLTLIPKPAPQAWTSLIEPDTDGDQIRTQFAEVIRAYQAGDQKRFERSTELLRAAVEGEIPGYQENLKSVVFAESIFNRIRPFLLSWIFYLSSVFLWSFSLYRPSSSSLRKLALGSTSLAVVFHVVGMALRCYVAGRPPVTNMYESVIWVSFGVVAFAGILYGIQRNGIILAVASVLAFLGLVAGDAAPMALDASIQPLVPVLRSNYWLTIHVLTITLGYAAFALTLGLANITLFQYLRKASMKKILGLNQLTYRSMQFGVVLIAAGTILGGIWADYSWGRFWGWDPKEVWALITLLAYLVILHGRYANWVGQFGFAAWSAVSFLTVVMAWYGVNFILGAGLHSYGFASGGTPWVVGFVSLQLAYVLFASWRHYQVRKK